MKIQELNSEDKLYLIMDGIIESKWFDKGKITALKKLHSYFNDPDHLLILDTHIWSSTNDISIIKSELSKCNKNISAFLDFLYKHENVSST